jgi:hypothetical protein
MVVDSKYMFAKKCNTLITFPLLGTIGTITFVAHRLVNKTAQFFVHDDTGVQRHMNDGGTKMTPTGRSIPLSDVPWVAGVTASPAIPVDDPTPCE